MSLYFSSSYSHSLCEVFLLLPLIAHDVFLQQLQGDETGNNLLNR